MDILYHYQKFLKKLKKPEEWAKYVACHQLSDKFIDKMLEENDDDELVEYIKKHQIKAHHRMNILKRGSKKVVEALLKLNISLSETEQLILLARRNPKFIELYLAPRGQLERRFSKKAEEAYILYLIKDMKAGIELFKVYVSTYRSSIAIGNILNTLFINIDTYTAQYVLEHVKLTEDEELTIVTDISLDKLEKYLSNRGLFSVKSQLMLIDRSMELADKYFKMHKSYAVAYAKYKKVRQELHDEKHTNISLSPENRNDMI